MNTPKMEIGPPSENDRRLLKIWAEGRERELNAEESIDGIGGALHRATRYWFDCMKQPVLTVFEIVQVESMAGIEQVTTGRWASVNSFREINYGCTT